MADKSLAADVHRPVVLSLSLEKKRSADGRLAAIEGAAIK
jgi:hypothetical protein